MGKFCSNCGAPLEENDRFCTKCGTRFEVEEPKKEETMHYQEAASQGTASQETASQGATAGTAAGNQARNTAGITERSIVLAIIFSIITCGIYGLYWMYKMNEDLNQITGDTAATSGGLVIVFSIITCGIYGWYWSYKMGQKVDNLTGSDSNKILFIVLAILALSIVNLAIMQDTVNKEITK